jgi:hypothetical protein
MSADRCDECGFVYDTAALAPQLPRLLRQAGAELAELLDTDHEYLRVRPAPETWSALEYACHVRDVLLAQRERMFLALVEQEPSFSPIYRDERVALARYDDQDPVAVSRDLEVATRLFADAFAGLDAVQRSRTCVYNYPEPAVRTVDWLAVHTLHECRHHVLDARRAATAGTRRTQS